MPTLNLVSELVRSKLVAVHWHFPLPISTAADPSKFARLGIVDVDVTRGPWSKDVKFATLHHHGSTRAVPLRAVRKTPQWCMLDPPIPFRLLDFHK